MSMNRFLAGILSISVLVSTQAASADFFLERVADASPERARMDNLTLGSYSFRNRQYAASYRDSLYFISSVKSEAFRRYSDGRISSYRYADTVNELETLVYSLENYYASLSSFERTGRRTYRDLAMDNLTDARASYARLKAITLKRQ